MIKKPWETFYWVIENKLAASNYPSSNFLPERRDKLLAISKTSIKAVISLQEDSETNHYGDLFYQYSADYNKIGIETFRFPIPDLSIPTVSEMKSILNKIDGLHKQNKPVMVHCWGGRGRTGTVIGCFLIRQKIVTHDDVLDFIDQLKKGTPLRWDNSPETIEQQEFIMNWKVGQ
jgi:protein-tyrosine phosphatase